MDTFLFGFEDELSKLAKAVPYTGRPPEISVNQPKSPGSFDWAGFDKKFKAEAAQVRRRREFKAKGGSGFQASKKGKWVRVPAPAPKPAAKRGRRAKAKKPEAKATPIPQTLARGAQAVSRAGTSALRAHGKTPGRARPPSSAGKVPPAPKTRPHRYSVTPREKPNITPRGRGTVTLGQGTVSKKMPVPPPTRADRLRSIVSKIVSKRYSGLPTPKPTPTTAAKPGGVD